MEKKIRLKKIIQLTILFIFLVCLPSGAFAQQQIYSTARPIVLLSTLSVSPSSQTILEGSTFDVSVILDSRNNSVNTIDLNIKFPADKLEIIKPSKDKSIFQVWLRPPVYSNTEGTASFTGIIPNGTTTSSGIVVTMTFKAKITGQATIKILPTSKVLANDGLGTEMSVDVINGNFIINPRPPGGIKVFSDTHPFEDTWYNNNDPIISWGEEQDAALTDFSFILDNKPFTVPDDVSLGAQRSKAYENVGDGLWYFHIKAKKQGVWGSTTHFLLRIDTNPPASFKPKLEFLTAAIIGRTMVSFFTADTLSGIDHYEVGLINKEAAPTQSPVFVQTESPYQIPMLASTNLRIIVRAVDKAGNIRDEGIDSYNFLHFIKTNFLFFIILIILIYGIIHYLFGHKIISRFKKILNLFKKEEAMEMKEEAEIKKEIEKKEEENHSNTSLN